MVKKSVFDKIADYDAWEAEIDELLAEKEELEEEQDETYEELGKYPLYTKEHKELTKKFEAINNRLLEIELKLEELYELEPEI